MEVAVRERDEKLSAREQALEAAEAAARTKAEAEGDVGAREAAVFVREERAKVSEAELLAASKAEEERARRWWGRRTSGCTGSA